MTVIIIMIQKSRILHTPSTLLTLHMQTLKFVIGYWLVFTLHACILHHNHNMLGLRIVICQNSHNCSKGYLSIKPTENSPNKNFIHCSHLCKIATSLLRPRNFIPRVTIIDRLLYCSCMTHFAWLLFWHTHMLCCYRSKWVEMSRKNIFSLILRILRRIWSW